MPILLQRGARLEAQADVIVQDMMDQGYSPEYNSSHTAYRWVNNETGDPYTGSTYGGVPVTRDGIFLKKRGLRRRIGAAVGDRYAAGDFGEPAYKVRAREEQAAAAAKVQEDAEAAKAAKAKETPDGTQQQPQTQQPQQQPMQFPPIILGPKWGDNVPGSGSLVPKDGTETKKEEETKTVTDKDDNSMVKTPEKNKYGLTPEEEEAIQMGILPKRYSVGGDWGRSFQDSILGRYLMGPGAEMMSIGQQGLGWVGNELGMTGPDMYNRGRANRYSNHPSWLWNLSPWGGGTSLEEQKAWKKENDMEGKYVGD